MTDIEELGRRVAEASGPGREIDRLLHVTFVEPRGTIYVWANSQPSARKPGYTSSIDAALALANRLLNSTPEAPDHPLEITISSVGHNKLGPWHCAIWCGHEVDGGKSYGPTPALAIIAALLKALSSIRPNGGAEE